MRSKFFNYGGLAAAVVLIAFGIGSLVIGISGRDTVRTSISKETIVGTPDMTPKAIAAAAKEAGLKNVDIPSMSVAGEKIDTGAEGLGAVVNLRLRARPRVHRRAKS